MVTRTRECALEVRHLLRALRKELRQSSEHRIRRRNEAIVLDDALGPDRLRDGTDAAFLRLIPRERPRCRGAYKEAHGHENADDGKQNFRRHELVLHPQDASNGDHADDLQRQADQHHLDSERIVDEQTNVVGRNDEENPCDDRRQRAEHPPRDTAVRADRAHLPLDLESIADDGGKLVQYLGQIAARLALGQHGGHEEAGVNQRNSLAERLQSVGQRHAEVLLVEEQPEFAADWLGNFVRHHLQRRRKCVARAYCSRNQIDRFRKLLLNYRQTLGGHILREYDRQITCRDAGQNRDREVGRVARYQRHRHEAGEDTGEDDRTDCRLEARTADEVGKRSQGIAAFRQRRVQRPDATQSLPRLEKARAENVARLRLQARPDLLLCDLFGPQNEYPVRAKDDGEHQHEDDGWHFHYATTFICSNICAGS